MREATTTRRVDYFNLPRPLWRKLKKHLPKKRNKSKKQGGRPRVSDRAVANAIWYVLFGRDANGRLCTASGWESPPVSSTSVSRGGGRWASSRS
jgi:transposase